MKKNVLIIIIVVLVILIGVTAYLVISNNKDNSSTDNNISNNDVNNQEDNNVKGDGKVLVVYYSAQSHTENVAKRIANNLNADIFEIEPVNEYTSDDLDYNDSNSRVSKEHDDESLRDIELKSTKVDNWDSYDTVLIGYPIWWGIAAWPVNNFVKDNDFTGKTVIPFCTSASSSLGSSGELLKNMAGTGNWKSGHRFSSNASDNDIKLFTDSIK